MIRVSETHLNGIYWPITNAEIQQRDIIQVADIFK